MAVICDTDGLRGVRKLYIFLGLLQWIQALDLHLTSSNNHTCPKLRWIFGVDHIGSWESEVALSTGSRPPAQFSESLS